MGVGMTGSPAGARQAVSGPRSLAGRCAHAALWVAAAFFLVGGLAGCANRDKTVPKMLTEKTIPTPKEVLETIDSQRLAAELPPISDIAPEVAEETAFPYEGKLFTLSARNVPLQDVLLAMASEAGLNLVIGPHVDRQEPISVEFNNVSLKNALDNLMQVHDYVYTIDDGILRVEALLTEVFHLDYPLTSSRPSSEVGGDVLGSGGSASSSDSDTVSAISNTDIKGEFRIEVQVEDEDHLDVWMKIEEALDPEKRRQGGCLLSELGHAQINRMGGTIVVTDRPSYMARIRKFLGDIQQSLKRQVIIEAKIVEVVLNQSHQYGIDWQYTRLNFLHAGGPLTMSANLTPNNISSTFTLQWLDPRGEDLGQILIDALATNGEVNVLSAPRLNVLNNQSALISVGKVVPFLDFKIGQTTVNVGNETRVVVDSVPVIGRFIDGITLGITPQISEDGVTTLHIVPVITEEAGSRTIAMPDLDEPVEIPVISMRESDTVVRVEDQTTIVIGGLIAEKTNDTSNKIPLLGDIPMLGGFFSHQARQTSKAELVILLTPTVVMR